MIDTKERVVIGWCENDNCGEPIYKGDIRFVDDSGEMYCDECYIEPEPREL